MSNQIIKDIVNHAAGEAKSIAINALKSLPAEELAKLVEAELQGIITPLEAEIKTTSSWWVRVRNRTYVTVLKSSTNSIVKTIQRELVKL